jgi:hypothetical protein
MTALWPDGVPCPNWRDYAISFGDGRTMTQIEAGPPRMRRRFSSMPDSATLSITMTRDQYAMFRFFFFTTLKSGSLPFWLRDPILDGTIMLDENGEVVLDEEDQPVNVEAQDICMFGADPPGVRMLSPELVSVTMTIFRMP